MPSETRTAQPIGPDWTETEIWLIPDWVENGDDPDDDPPPPRKAAARQIDTQAPNPSDTAWRRRTRGTGSGVH